jgi:hypothetical protein
VVANNSKEDNQESATNRNRVSSYSYAEEKKKNGKEPIKIIIQHKGKKNSEGISKTPIFVALITAAGVIIAALISATSGQPVICIMCGVPTVTAASVIGVVTATYPTSTLLPPTVTDTPINTAVPTLRPTFPSIIPTAISATDTPVVYGQDAPDGMDIGSYCYHLQEGWGASLKDSSWKCTDENGSVMSNVTLSDVCQYQFDNQYPYVAQKYRGNPYSYYCHN